jgi:hypothetical protein
MMLNKDINEKGRQMLKEITLTTATLDMDGFTLTAEGSTEDVWDWTITQTTKGTGYSHSWTRRDWFMDEGEIEEMLWEEATAIMRKYSHLSFEHTTEEIEEEEEE